MPSFHYQDCELYYQSRSSDTAKSSGEPGKTLVFLHGLGADSEQAMALCKGLDEVRVISVDMPGHGKSVCSEREQFSFELFAEVCKALMDTLGIERAIVGGISMGGGISLQVALRWPERVEALLLQRPAWLNESAIKNLEIVASTGLWIEMGGLSHAREKLEQHSMLRALDQTLPACAESIRALLSRPQAETSSAVLPAMSMDQPYRFSEQLNAIQVPSLIVSCKNDPLHPVEIAEALAAGLKGSSYREIPSRYLKPESHFQAFTQHAQQFIGRL